MRRALPAALTTFWASSTACRVVTSEWDPAFTADLLKAALFLEVPGNHQRTPGRLDRRGGSDACCGDCDLDTHLEQKCGGEAECKAADDQRNE